MMEKIEKVEMTYITSLDVREVEDRCKVTKILAKNGYVVSHGRRREPGKKAYIFTVEVYRKDGSGYEES